MKIIIRPPNKIDLEPHHLHKILQLINAAYDEAEAGLWKPGSPRVKDESLKSLLENKSLLIAEVAGQVIGCVKVSLINASTAEFGLLAVDFDYRGQGVGRDLVLSAEQWAIDHGCSVMQLNLLTPLHQKHPNKEFLQQWYTRIGYVAITTQPFAEIDPERVDYLLMPCEFAVYQKNLLSQHINNQ